MHNREQFINTFTLLGKFLRQFPARTLNDAPELAALNNAFYEPLQSTLDREHLENPWFTTQWLDQAILGIAQMLEEDVMQRWLGAYNLTPPSPGKEKTVGLVLAGNIPLVGFHDMLCVLASGHRILAKPSSKDERLVRKMAEVIIAIDPEMGERITFKDEQLSGMDAVIATGSDNSARYFEYYFRDIPHIIRKNRNGVALLTGDESEDDLEGIGRDIFTYFGLGCRNVTKIYVPDGYDLKVFMGVMDRFHHLGQHHKYANNVEYYRSIYLMNLQEFLDNGVLLLKEDSSIASPVGVVFYERYSELAALEQQLKAAEEEIQCTVTIASGITGGLPPGTTQQPMPWDYADGVDTISFLTKLR
ncbi:MAG: acyl-CoA reductase [Bacteroidota bacterium]